MLKKKRQNKKQTNAKVDGYAEGDAHFRVTVTICDYYGVDSSVGC